MNAREVELELRHIEQVVNLLEAISFNPNEPRKGLVFEPAYWRARVEAIAIRRDMSHPYQGVMTLRSRLLDRIFRLEDMASDSVELMKRAASIKLE
jgi:hypothetical protein